MNFSLTYRAAIIQLLVTLAVIFGVEVEQEAVETTVEVIAAFIAAGMVVYGRFRAGGIHWTGKKH